MRHEFEPEELDFLSADTGSDPWAEGFSQGRIEVLDAIIPPISEKVNAVLADDIDLPDSVLDLLEVLDRWIMAWKGEA